MTPRSAGRGLAVTAVAAVLTLAGCGSGAEPNPESPPTAVTAPADAAYNDADLHFAQALAPHHDQAIEMSTMLLDKSRVDPDVRTIAKRIRAQHQPQLDLIITWRWAEERSAHGADEDGPSHHGGEDGLMTEDQMQALDLATGPTATILYLDGMIRHHEGALAMAEAEAKTGKHPDAVTLARAVVDNHHTEIDTLRELRAKR